MHVKNWLNYDPLTGVFTWKKSPGNHVHVGDVAGTTTAGGYISITIDGERFFAHRIAFIMMDCDVPDLVDHKNGIKTDNRWCNLREADKCENSCNAKLRVDNKWGIKGLSWDSSRKQWRCSITYDGVTKSVRFHIYENAVEWLAERRIELHQLFARFE